MRLILISDTHNQHDKLQIPDGDVLIHAGDICQSMSRRNDGISQVRSFNRWLGSLPHKHKLVIAGNHDFIFQERNLDAREELTNATYLQDSGASINGVQFWGSPWQPWYGGWAFNARRGPDIDTIWAKIPRDTGVLITHGPPRGIGDHVDGTSAGCADLLRRIDDLDNLKLHVFGHIHNGRGSYHHNGVAFENVASVNGQYEITHPPVVFDLPDPG